MSRIGRIPRQFKLAKVIFVTQWGKHIIAVSRDDRLIEVARWIWCAITLAVSLAAGGHWNAPVLANDSYQYLSEAREVGRGNGISTTLVHYDPERSHGTIPAPATHYPPGYPLAVAVASLSQLNLINSAWLISLLSLSVTVWLVDAAVSLLGASMWARVIACVFTVANSKLLLAANSVGTESLFTVFALAAIVSLMKYEIARQPYYALLGGICSGLAFSVRYAGIFLLFAVLGFYGLRWLRQRTRESLIGALWVASAVVISGLIVLRNQLLGAHLTGGGARVVHHSFLSVVKLFITSVFHIFYGSAVVTRLGVPELVLAAGLLLFAIALFKISRERIDIPRAALPMLVYIAVYAVGMFYLGFTSDIAFGPRMFVPLAPLVFATLAWAGSIVASRLPDRRIFAVSIALIGCSYIYVNVRDVLALHITSPHEIVADAIGGLRMWIDREISSKAVLMAASGQATGFYLDRPTLSLAPSDYSDAHWDEPTLKAVSQRFGAKYLFLYPHMSDDQVDGQAESPFLKGVIAGNVPSWLKPVASNDNTLIYEIIAR